MAQGIDIKIGSSFDAAGITEANKSLAKLAQDVGSANQQLRQATLKAAADINSYASAADKACRAMGGGYKDASQFVKDAMGAYLNASKSVKQASGAFDDFNAVMRRAAEAVDKRNASIKQAAEVSKVLKKKQRELAAITDTSSEAYKRASRNVEILKQALASLGVKASAANKPVETVPSKFKTAFSSAAGHVKGFASAIGRNLMNIKAGFEMMTYAATKAAQLVTKAFVFEKMTVQFKMLLGNLSDARRHMQDLQDLGDTPPFSLEQFAAASRSLLVLTQGVLGFKESLKTVGDVAAATGQSVESIAHEVGRAFAFIRDGQSISSALMPLVNLGVIAPEVMKKLQGMQSAGASSVEMWREFEASLKRFNGAMDETEKTAEGLMAAIGSQKDDILREFGAALLDVTKGGLSLLLEKMKELRSSGAIAEWAKKARDAVYTVIGAFKGLGEAQSRQKAFGALSDIVVGSFELAAKNAVSIIAKAAPAIGSLIAKGIKGFVFGSEERNAARKQMYDEAGGMSRDEIKNKYGRATAYDWTDEWNKELDRREKDLLKKSAAKDAEELYGDGEGGNSRLEKGLGYFKRLGKEAGKYRERMVKLDEGDGNGTGRPSSDDEEAKRKDEALKAADEKRRRADISKNYYEYEASGSTDTFENWMKAKKKAEAEKLKEDKKAYAEFQKKSGIDTLANADDVSETDENFKAWRVEHDKKVAQERADNQKTAELKQQAEVSAANEASRIRIENARDELKAAQDSASSQQSAASNAQTEFDRAFAMYRSDDKGAAQIAEERDYAADYKQLKKDAARYGGKWRIDELSNLIAAGDTQGQAAKLEEWRKSKSFTPEVESMVRAAAADDAKTTAEDELRKIAKNTEGLSQKLDQLLQVK